MHVVIVCDSKFGNTAQVARAAQTALAEGNTVDLRSADEGIGDLAGVDLLLVGGPTHAHGASAPLKAALGALPRGSRAGMRAAPIDTRDSMSRLLTGSAAAASASLLRRAGARSVVAPESFFVTRDTPPTLEAGELERVAAWALSVA
jgi:flavodoxin